MSSGAGDCRDVLQEIAERIPLHKDILRCAAVCRQWRSIVMGNLHRLPQKLPLCYCLPPQHPLPLLMQCNDEEVSGKVEFLSVLDNKYFTDFFVAEISGNWVAGSSNGWLVLVKILGPKKMSLLNPLTRAQISLPSLSDPGPSSGLEYDSSDFAFIIKALVISEPNVRNLDSCIVLAIASDLEVLSFCRPGDEKWTYIEGCPILVKDVIPYKGQVYAVVYGGALLSFDVEHHGVTLVAGHASCDVGLEDWERYLVESPSGDLLLVVRIVSYVDDLRNFSMNTIDFCVYKLEEVDETQVGVVKASYALYTIPRSDQVTQAVKYQWVRLKSLDDQILFIGRNCSKAVPASIRPDLKGNCIYFTDDDPFHRHAGIAKRKARGEGFRKEKYDMGIYDMAEKSVLPVRTMEGKFFRLPPVWVEPNPWQ